MALLYSPSKTQPPGGRPTLHLDRKPGDSGEHSSGRRPTRALEAKWEAPGRAAAPEGPLCPGDTPSAICMHVRRGVSFSEHRSVVSAELIAYPMFSVCMRRSKSH